jgi:hypothetical protein
VALRLPTGAFLCSDASGALGAVAGHLRPDKQAKLFRLEEMGVPAYALASWPVRCCLSNQEGVYMSASMGKLVALAEVACCAEELVVDLQGAARAEAGGAAAPAQIWGANQTRLASVERLSGQVLFQPQHCGLGGEDFTAHMLPGNQLALRQTAPDGSAAGVVCSWPAVRCLPGAKPSTLCLELARARDALIITAHGHLLGARLSQLSGRLHAAAACGAAGAPQLRAAAWQFESHGDAKYSIHHAASGRQLYVDAYGALSIDGARHVTYPDPCTLFVVELTTWTPAPTAGAAQHEPQTEQGGSAPSPGFVTLGEGACIAGFTICTAARFRGQRLMLSALPDGRITTVHASGSPNRWELFQVADLEAATGSSLQPLRRLPQPTPAAVPAAGGLLRRSSSTQGLSALPATPRVHTSRSETALPHILEAAEEAEGAGGAAHGWRPAPPSPTATSAMPPRRCVSETALSVRLF